MPEFTIFEYLAIGAFALILLLQLVIISRTGTPPPPAPTEYAITVLDRLLAETRVELATPDAMFNPDKARIIGQYFIQLQAARDELVQQLNNPPAL